jgi:hypothetical protein
MVSSYHRCRRVCNDVFARSRRATPGVTRRRSTAELPVPESASIASGRMLTAHHRNETSMTHSGLDRSYHCRGPQQRRMPCCCISHASPGRRWCADVLKRYYWAIRNLARRRAATARAFESAWCTAAARPCSVCDASRPRTFDFAATCRHRMYARRQCARRRASPVQCEPAWQATQWARDSFASATL